MARYINEVFEYPLVIKKVANDIVISAPDLALYQYIKINESDFNLDNSSISSKIADEVKNMWDKIQNHLEHRKWQPIPSTFKQSLEKPQEDFSLPEFTKKLNQYMSVSENTLRREIQRGVIRCYQTEGGHRRIPASEIAAYLNYCEKLKPKNDSL